MKVIITAGGTGGHIYPALAILNKIAQMEPSSEFLYIGTTNRMEATLVPKLNIPFYGIEMMGLDRKNIFNNIKVFFTYRKAIEKAMIKIKEFNPDIVIGVGGYITVPVITAAKKLGCKTLIHEQNAIPGISNKKLSKVVDRVCVSLPDSVTAFGGNNVVYTGNPRSEEIVGVKPADKKKYGFSSKRKLVIIVMGSLGSTTMTKKLKELVVAFKDKKYQVLIITGKNYYSQYEDVKSPENVAIVPYLDDLLNLLKVTDLIISRAGASTIAEVTAIGLPSILVPSPYVTHNHQLMNAKELESIGACKIVLEKDFSKDTLLPQIDTILNDEIVYNNMKLAAQSLKVTDSATKIYYEAKKIIGEK